MHTIMQNKGAMKMSKKNRTLGKVIGGTLVVATSLACIAVLASGSTLKTIKKEVSNMSKSLKNLTSNKNEDEEEIIIHEVAIENEEE